MRRIIVLIILIIITIHSYSQDSGYNGSTMESSLYDIQRNSLYIGSHVLSIDALYERIIPTKDKFGFLTGVGIVQEIGFTDRTLPVGKVGCMIGRNKHFIEIGILISPRGDDVLNKFMPIIGYRCQYPNGFLFRADITLIHPGIAFGYSF